jgi:flavorubredoxin
MDIFSHQDPDIVAGANGWLITTNATALASKIWLRFIAHFGVDRLVVDRIKGLFEEHIKYMEGFHGRYILSGKALRLWAKMVRQLDIETIARQHGTIFKGKEMVNKFKDWVSSLETGLDIMDDVYKIPTERL